MKTYELADLLAVVDTDVQGNVRAIPFSWGAFLLHHSGIWLWLDETKRLTNNEKKEVFNGLGLPDVTTGTTSIDDNTVWGIGHDKPLMSIPFTLEQLDEFDKVSGRTISESIKPIDDEDFSASLIGASASEIARFILFREVPTDKAAPVQNTLMHAPVVADGIDYTMVATRSELIGAFGGITKMNITWFDNLSDTPRLKAARKHTGRGGRNSSEPLFCPFEVMQWLVYPKRKKGKPINESTAWRLLKGHFPKVYNKHSIGDPNAD